MAQRDSSARLFAELCAYLLGYVYSGGKGCGQERCPLEGSLWMGFQGYECHHPQTAGPNQEVCGGSWSETSILTVFIQEPTTLLHLPQRTQELALTQTGVPEAGGLCISHDH